MSFAPHATFELRKVNYNTFHIKNVPYILVTFDVDVLFELPPINNLDGHYSQMKRMDKSTMIIPSARSTNTENDFNFTFHMIRCWGHLECQNQLFNYLVLNGTPNETA